MPHFYHKELPDMLQRVEHYQGFKVLWNDLLTTLVHHFYWRFAVSGLMPLRFHANKKPAASTPLVIPL
ncbi:hypothetical protein ACQKE5_04435 [Paenisporosarcina sp. NPDC076898]|uniref:hypothetical protein n=1 Tax=Paenisporosarcina sp. NPDC076898 TaxID=3390603 RepID=UPI003CFDD669